MNKLLLGSAAFFLLSVGVASATDMPINAPVYKAAEPIYDWSGLYVGVYSGVGVQRSHGRDPFDGSTGVGGVIEHTGTGFTGGGTLGYNWQYGRNWVLGIEGDFGYLGLSHQVTDFVDAQLIYNSKTSWISTLRARVGYSNGPTLTYITGGGAWVQVKDSRFDQFVPLEITSSKTFGGYAVGTGTETMLGGNWTAKAEYLFVDVGAGDTTTSTGFPLQIDKHRYHLMKFGLNYLFGAKPQPALPQYNWGGFYVGIVGGTTVTHSVGTDPTGGNVGEIGNNGRGFTIGGQLGYNWQLASRWVAGVEGDFSYLGIDHSNLNYDNRAVLGVKTNWIATLRGRVGYSTGPALFYVTAGGAWVDVRDNWTRIATLVSSTKIGSGYTVGGGLETVLSGNWATKTEYLFVDVGDGATQLSDGSFNRTNHKFQLFRSALSYKFGSQ